MSAAPPPDPAVTLARIEVKLDQALRNDVDHEKRLRALEARNWPRSSLNLWVSALAAAAAAGALLEPILTR